MVICCDCFTWSLVYWRDSDWCLLILDKAISRFANGQSSEYYCWDLFKSLEINSPEQWDAVWLKKFRTSQMIAYYSGLWKANISAKVISPVFPTVPRWILQNHLLAKQFVSFSLSSSSASIHPLSVALLIQEGQIVENKFVFAKPIFQPTIRPELVCRRRGRWGRLRVSRFRGHNLWSFWATEQSNSWIIVIPTLRTDLFVPQANDHQNYERSSATWLWGRNGIINMFGHPFGLCKATSIPSESCTIKAFKRVVQL